VNTIKNIIFENGKDIQDTVYNRSKMLDFVMPTAGMWSLKQEDTKRDSYNKIIALQELKKKYINKSKLRELDFREKTLTEMTTEAIQSGAEIKSAEVIELGKQKAEIRKEKKMLTEEAERKAIDKIFGKDVKAESIFSACYKDSLTAISFEELQHFNKSWSGAEYDTLMERPLFVGNLERIKGLLEKKNTPIGIEGGSCLFGTDEMRFVFKMKNGEVRRFDFNTMQEYLPGREFTHEATTELYDFIQSEGEDIQEALVDCPKTAVTIDEYDAVNFIFLFAKGLNAKVVITIPDMSYDKTFVSFFSGLDDKIYKPFHDKFLAECRRMSDVSIKMINNLAERYSIKDYEIFYYGNQEKCKLFEEKKQYYLDGYKKKDKMTTRGEMIPALRDYVCMPALPFYFYGIKDVIEINRLEEIPSVEKCRGIHRSDFRLYEIMYPQRIGKNGKTAGFYAEFDKKEFIQ